MRPDEIGQRQTWVRTTSDLSESPERNAPQVYHETRHFCILNFVSSIETRDSTRALYLMLRSYDCKLSDRPT